VSEHARPSGPLALIIRPDGTATAGRLPGPGQPGATAIHDAIGGYFEGVSGPGADWVAYVAEDERHFPGGLLPNLQADAIARALGWDAFMGDYLKGTAVFLGRQGVEETDVPQHVLDLARAAGLI